MGHTSTYGPMIDCFFNCIYIDSVSDFSLTTKLFSCFRYKKRLDYHRFSGINYRHKYAHRGSASGKNLF